METPSGFLEWPMMIALAMFVIVPYIYTLLLWRVRQDNLMEHQMNPQIVLDSGDLLPDQCMRRGWDRTDCRIPHNRKVSAIRLLVCAGFLPSVRMYLAAPFPSEEDIAVPMTIKVEKDYVDFMPDEKWQGRYFHVDIQTSVVQFRSLSIAPMKAEKERRMTIVVGRQ